MSGGLIALLDDVAGIAKIAASSVDDVVAQAGKVETIISAAYSLGRIAAHRTGNDTHESTAIREWVEARYPELTVDGTAVYDLTQPPVISQPGHSSGPR